MSMTSKLRTMGEMLFLASARGLEQTYGNMGHEGM